MPTPNGRSWLGDKALRVWDKLGPSGNNYNRDTGQWSATPGQYATGIGSTVLKLINPALGQVASQVANGYYGSGPLAGMMGKVGATPQATAIGPVTRQQIGFPSGQLGGGGGMGQPNMSIPTMPNVQAEQPWTGSLAGSNPFGGAYGGNLGFGSGQRQFGRAAGSFTPHGAGVIQVAGTPGGADAARSFGIGAGSGGSAGGYALSDAIALHKKFAR